MHNNGAELRATIAQSSHSEQRIRVGWDKNGCADLGAFGSASRVGV
jgi:hypothetical protein